MFFRSNLATVPLIRPKYQVKTREFISYQVELKYLDFLRAFTSGYSLSALKFKLLLSIYKDVLIYVVSGEQLVNVVGGSAIIGRGR